MERTKKVTNESGVRWKKLPGAPLELYDGRVIEPGHVFTSKLNNIPEAFIDLVECLEPDQLTEQIIIENKLPEVNPYELQPADKPNWWNVVHVDGKVINEKPLRKKEAETLLKSLNE